LLGGDKDSGECGNKSKGNHGESCGFKMKVLSGLSVLESGEIWGGLRRTPRDEFQYLRAFIV
jgi:hypothetical protein